MTPDQAADLAARTLAAIDADCGDQCEQCVYFRERVASDLDGLGDHAVCAMRNQPCSDLARYAAGLERTAALYGVTG